MQLGLLPPGADNKDLSRVAIRDTCGEAEDMFEYLTAPYTLLSGKYVVKGAQCEFKSDTLGGPHTKYDALFDVRPAFDGLRFAFLLHVGGAALADLRAAVMSNRDKMLPRRSYQMLMSFVEKFKDVFTEHRLDEQPANFAARAWPVLRQCLILHENII